MVERGGRGDGGGWRVEMGRGGWVSDATGGTWWRILAT